MNRLTDERARAEILELRRIMTEISDPERMDRVIHSAAHLLFIVPETWRVSVESLIYEAERRQLLLYGIGARR